MKIRFTLLALLALLSFSVIACEEDPVSPDNPTMEAEVDGDTKSTESVVSQAGIITGAFADTSSITITLGNATAVGTYDIAGSTFTGSLRYTDGLTIYTAKTGELEILTYDAATGVTGNFAFTAVSLSGDDTVDVTDGTFSAAFD